MSLESSVLGALRAHRELGLSASASLVSLTERSFQLQDGDSRFLVKWIADSDTWGQNEIRANMALVQLADAPAPRMVSTVEVAGATIACWEWLAGTDLRVHSRELLPTAFAQLGRFHLARRHHGPLCSPTTGKAYGTIEALLAHELALLSASLDGAIRASCAPFFGLLGQAGYPTIVHGDMHPGNILSCADGLRFVDWAYSLSSLNLFDLSYIQSVPLAGDSEAAWWAIGPQEARAILPAYFQASGLDAANYPRDAQGRHGVDGVTVTL